MKKNFFKMFLATGLMMNLAAATLEGKPKDNSKRDWVILNDIPVMENTHTDPNYEFIKDVAQYKQADWSQVVGRTANITVRQAKKIADANPEITYFFYVKGYSMVLETSSNEMRLFSHGDAVFFSGTPWWGSAPGLADGYVKTNR